MSAAGDNPISSTSSSTAEAGSTLPAAIKAAKHWVNQLSRSIKTCRLYDSTTGPLVERSRFELTNELQRVVDEFGPLVLRFTSDDILTEGTSLYPARSREDNLALPFYRDGVRTITFSPGVDVAEVGKVIDAILLVTANKDVDDDLVTLLWQAQFEHVEIEYVPAEAEMGSGGGSDSSGPARKGGGFGVGLGDFGPDEGDAGGSSRWGGAAGGGNGSGGGGFGSGFAEVEVPGSTYASAEAALSDMPWPESIPFDLSGIEAVETTTAPEPVTDPGPGRSDDWEVDSDTVEAEATLEELEVASAPNLEAFRARLEQARDTSAVTAAIDLSRAYLAACEGDDDRFELEKFVTTIVRHAVAEGSWDQAGTAFDLIAQCRRPEWSVNALAEELCHPRLLAATTSQLETYDAARVDQIIAFAKRLDEWAIDLLGQLLAEADASRHQARLIDAIANECRTCPERLAPWLADPRWTVVRNTVRILEEIGGDPIAGLLQSAATHPEPQVRDAVVSALEQVSVAKARPMLLGLLDDVDTRMFCTIVTRLSRARDTAVAELMLGYLTHPEFEKQPIEERRAVYSAVVGAGGDDVLPGLEAELHNQNWFDHGKDAHRQAVANCILQIGTPQARRVLERGAKSRRAGLRKACEDMLARFGKK